jgi:hypothetical protein
MYSGSVEPVEGAVGGADRPESYLRCKQWAKGLEKGLCRLAVRVPYQPEAFVFLVAPTTDLCCASECWHASCSITGGDVTNAPGLGTD